MISKKRKTSKYLFILKNVNTENVDKKYNISLISNIMNIDENHPNTTKLTELTDDTKKTCHTISFLDESKKIYKCNISMIDVNLSQEISSKKYNCFWCRHNFNSKSIGCPINYISNKVIKNYHSEVSKDNYTIKENITNKKLNIFNNKKFVFSAIKDKINSVIDIENQDYYETDGTFCSFNCCKSFIKDNKHNKIYDKSDILLSKMYFEITGLNTVINEAPSWRLLEEYGGSLSINEFRENFNKISYDFHGIFKNNLFKSVGYLFEEKMNF